MRTGRPKQALILTDEERDRLQSLAHRARSQPLLARRARVVLACAKDWTTKPWRGNCGARWVWWASGVPDF